MEPCDLYLKKNLSETVESVVEVGHQCNDKVVSCWEVRATVG